MNRPRIVFMGTPAFAVESLRAITEKGYPVAGVVTAMDKPSGRGLQLHPSPVKQYALEHRLPLLQPDRLKDPEFIENLRKWQADLQVVVAFRMLPEEVWSMPPLGTFNLHASLLPQYRGAAPINWAIINGEKRTGLTTFFLDHEIDTGKMICRKEVMIGDHESAGELHDRLMKVGSELVVKTIDAIANGTANPQQQETQSLAETLKMAPKIQKSDCRVQWNSPVIQIHNFIRGLSPFPGAWTELDTGKGTTINFRLLASRALYGKPEATPGSVFTDQKNYLEIAALDGFLAIDQLQMQGKNRMGIHEFLRGFRFPPSSRFS